MSHSVVAVIIDQNQKLSDVLAPFDENMRVAPYVAFTREEKLAERAKTIATITRNLEREMAKPKEKRNAEWMERASKYKDELEGMTEDEFYAKQCEGRELNEHGQPTSTYNPNSKWDWYSVGGRWAGHFKVKDGVAVVGWPGDGVLPVQPSPAAEAPAQDADPGEIDLHAGTSPVDEPRSIAWRGEQSWGARDEGIQYPEGFADAALKRDIDFDGTLVHNAEIAGRRYDLARTVVDGIAHLPYVPWSKFIERMDSEENLDPDEARNLYHAQEIVVAWRGDHGDGSDKDLRSLRTWNNIDDFLEPREEYVRKRASEAVVPFAVLKDGEWIEKGSMGWWGIVSGEKDESVWRDQFQRVLDTVRDDQVIVMVDVHI